MTNRFYPAVVVALSDEDGGGFLAFAPDLMGCMGDGDTPEAALSDLKGAVQAWCAEMVRLEREIPEPGSAARASRDREAALVKIIREQQAALERQDEQFDELQAEISKIRREVDELFASIADTGPAGNDWAYSFQSRVVRTTIPVPH